MKTKNNIHFLFEMKDEFISYKVPKIIANMQRLATNGDIEMAISLGEQLISLMDKKYDSDPDHNRRYSDEKNPSPEVKVLKSKVQMLVDRLKDKLGKQSAELEELRRRSGIL